MNLEKEPRSIPFVWSENFIGGTNKSYEENINEKLSKESIQLDSEKEDLKENKSEIQDIGNLGVNIKNQELKNTSEEELLRKKEIENKELYELERRDKKILLETLCIHRANIRQEKVCTWLTENSTTNRMPNIIGEEDQMEEIDDICDSIDTLWSSDKQKEGLWIRGHQDKVKELIKFNWDDLLKSPNYRNQNIQNSDFILDEFDFLSLQNCQVKKEKNNDWIEIKYLLT